MLPYVVSLVIKGSTASVRKVISDVAFYLKGGNLAYVDFIKFVMMVLTLQCYLLKCFVQGM